MSDIAFSFTVTGTLVREQGKFASKDELLEQIKDALNDADPQSIEGENGGEYNVEDWEVTEA